MLSKQLSDMGFSEKEAASYLALLRAGTQSTSFIAKKAGLNRGTAYVALHSLLEKGVVAKSTKKKIQYFTALPPQHLLSYLERREQQIEAQKNTLQGLMSQFEALVNPFTTKPKIEFFEGQDGARSAIEDTLKSQDPILRSFLSIVDVGEFVGAEFFHNYTERRIQNGLTLHAIRTRDKDKAAWSQDEYSRRYVTSKKDSREVRYVSEELAFPITIYMYDNKLMVMSSKEENFALIIESAELAEMQKKLFALIWKSVGPTTTKMS